jgi:hypothetical protein
MEQEQPLEPVIVVDTRKPYSKPQLVEYGRVGEITQSGGTPYPFGEDGFYTLTSI